MQEAPINFWSFSAVTNWESCAYFMYLDRVEKAEKPDVSDDPKHPLVRGDRVHTEGENYVKGEGPFTKDLKRFTESFGQLRRLYDEGLVRVEEKWAFTEEWGVTTWEDKENRWLLIICDAVVLDIQDGEVKSVRIIDYKTGKSMGNEVKHQQQLQLYAVAAALMFPEATVFTGEMWYLDEGKSLVRRFNRSQIAGFAQRWWKRGKALTSATVFPPKPNTRNCKFCDFGPNKGTGVCPYAPDPL